MLEKIYPKVKFNFLKSNPLFKFLIILIGGFFLGLLTNELINVFSFYFKNINSDFKIFSIGLILVSLVITNIYLFIQKYYNISYVITIMTLGFFCFNFNYNIGIFDDNKNIRKTYLFEPKEVILEGEIKKILKVNENSIKFIADCKLASNFLPHHRALISINLKSIPKNFELAQNNKFNLIAKVRTPRAKTFISTFDEKKYAENNNIKWFADSRFKDFSLIESNSDGIKNNFNLLISNQIKNLFNTEYQSYIFAFILGDKSKLDFKNKDVYAQNGTAHIFAVSGLHIGVYVFMLLFIFSFIKNEKLKYIIISLLLVIYCILIDYPDSTIRTIFVIILIFYFSVEQLKKNYLNVLSGFLVMLLVFLPTTINNIGMQYSICAFGSILLFNDRILEKFRIKNIKNKFVKLILNSIAFSFSVSILIFPLNSYYFNNFNILSILINVITIPIMSLSIFYSLISIIVSFVSIDIAGYFAFISEFLIFMSNKINYFMFDFGNSFQIKYYSFGLSLIFSILILIILYSKKNNLLFFRLMCLLSILIIFLNFNYYKITNNESSGNKFKIINNLQSSSIIIENKEFIVIIYEQRKFYNYYFPEFELINYINENQKKIIFVYSGDLGYELIKIVKQHQFNSNKINSSEFNSLRLKLKDIDDINSILKVKNLYYKI